MNERGRSAVEQAAAELLAALDAMPKGKPLSLNANEARGRLRRALALRDAAAAERERLTA